MSRHEEHERIRRRLRVLTAAGDAPADHPSRVPLPLGATDRAASSDTPIARSLRRASRRENRGRAVRTDWFADTEPLPSRGAQPEEEPPILPRPVDPAHHAADDYDPGSAGSRPAAGPRRAAPEDHPFGHGRAVESRTSAAVRGDALSGARRTPRVRADDPGHAPVNDDPRRTGDVPEPDWLDGPRATRWREHLPERFASARLALSRRAVASLALVGLAAVVLAGYAVWRERPVVSQAAPVPAVRMAAETSEQPEPKENDSTPGELVVSVVGMVHRGGLVRLPQGARVADALDAAGGAVAGADLHGLNLAQRVADGDQILVGAADPAAPPRASGTAGSGAAPAPGGTSATAPTGRVNLNTATEAELDALPGVGPVTARAIVAWRAGNGPFTDIEQLGDVEGIGPARLAKLRAQVTL